MDTIRLIILASLLTSTAGAQDRAPFPPAPQNVSSTATIASGNEPGERLVITGTVYRADGTTPYSGLVLFVYQTDADGVYNKTDGSYLRPRLHGWIITDAKGRYEIRTIKPGTYPRGKTPAHIHVTMKPAERPAVWLDSFLFDEDPYLTPADRSGDEKGRFSSILRTRKDKEGVLLGQRDFRIRDDK